MNSDDTLVQRTHGELGSLLAAQRALNLQITGLELSKLLETCNVETIALTSIADAPRPRFMLSERGSYLAYMYYSVYIDCLLEFLAKKNSLSRNELEVLLHPNHRNRLIQTFSEIYQLHHEDCIAQRLPDILGQRPSYELMLLALIRALAQPKVYNSGHES